jgi:hypothetical protein
MPVRSIALVGALAIGALGVASTSASRATGGGRDARRIFVRVPADPTLIGGVRLRLSHAPALARGGYYYAVVVLTGYAGYSSSAPPACAVSSDMQETQYGFPGRRRRVTLALIPAPSAAGRWCAGGVYRGAIYAVPHRPRCTSTYPCYGERSESGPCWQVEGRRVCGVVAVPEGTEKPIPGQPQPAPPPREPEVPVANPTYSYPGGLPKPVDRASRTVGRFTLRF